MSNDKQTKTGMGLVTEIRDATTKKGKPYFWVTIGGEEFSCWKPGLKKQLAVDCSVQFQYTEDEETEYKNIVSVEANGDPPTTAMPQQNGKMSVRDQIEVRKQFLIAKESCLKSAVDLVKGNVGGEDDMLAQAKTVVKVYRLWLPLLLPDEKGEPPEPKEGE